MGRALIVLLAAFALPAVGHGQDTLYVTDKLLLGLYPKPEATGEALATLVSGTPLQAIERGKYYTRVRTADGTEGWVKSAYLVTDKPPRLMLDELQAEKDALTQRLERTRQQLATAQDNATTSDAQLRQLESGQEQRTAKLSQLESENRSLHQRLASEGVHVPIAWLIAAAIFCLALGLWGGYAWVDYRIRRRHGGFRIY